MVQTTGGGTGVKIVDLETAMADWHIGKYGSTGIAVPATLRKLGEEYGELMEAIMTHDHEKIAEEATDVLFVMTHIVRHFCGVGAFNEAVENKLKIVNERLLTGAKK